MPIRVGFAPGAVLVAGTDAQLKVNPETKQPQTDRETNARLFTVQLMLMEEGRAELLKVTVPEYGLPNGLKPGVMVVATDLFANPWARIFNGQLSQGVAYRASSLTLAQPAPAAAVAAEESSADLATQQSKAAAPTREQPKKAA